MASPAFAILFAAASLAHAMLAVTLGPSIPAFFKTVYEPKFFEVHLSLSDKITAWPAASLQLVTIVLLLSVMALVTASVG